MTCHANLDLGFGIFLYGHDLDGHPVLSCRVHAINAPELGTDAGKAAQAAAVALCPPGTRVHILSNGFDKFGGRFDGTITLPDGRDFGQAMLDGGFAVPYKV